MRKWTKIIKNLCRIMYMLLHTIRVAERWDVVRNLFKCVFFKIVIFDLGVGLG